MTEKILGYFLLIIGICVMLFCTFNVYQVFTRQIEPIQLFNLPAPQLDVGQMMAGSIPEEFAGMVPKNASSKQEIMSADVINQPFNITAHLFLMGFIAGTGFKLASLGVMLVRTLVVKVRGVEEHPTTGQTKTG